jgi:hypothetical protein
MLPWADRLLASAIVARSDDHMGQVGLPPTAEPVRSHLPDDAVVTAQLLAGDAEAALAECDRRLPRLKSDGLVRSFWVFEELRIRVLLALGRFDDAGSAAETALSVVEALGWRMLAWRLHASRAAAMAARGDKRAAEVRRTAVELLTAVAATLPDTPARSRFLSQRVAASLLQ